MLLSEKSYAKINLFLYVISKRDDAYHDILTLFIPITLADTINISASQTFRLRSNSNQIPTNSKNIIMRVDEILRNEYSLTDNFDVEIVKRIPVGAGLGGGSSNAASYLKMVNKISKLNLSYEQMADIMQRVGSDTVFFLKSTPAVACKRGEVLTDFALNQRLFILLINPNIHISTHDVYSDKNLLLTDVKTVSNINKLEQFDELLSAMKNDLERPVFALYPQIRSLLEELDEFDKSSKSMMSGSGSTVFSVYRDAESRDVACSYFRSKYSHYFVYAAENL